MIDNYDTIVTTTQGYKVNNIANNNNLSTINANSLSYNRNYGYNKSAKTIQMSASTPYMQPKTISNRVIPTNNNNNTNTIAKPYQYSNNQQQRSSIMLNSHINLNDNNNNDNNFDSNETKSKFSYS